MTNEPEPYLYLVGGFNASEKKNSWDDSSQLNGKEQKWSKAPASQTFGLPAGKLTVWIFLIGK